VFAVNFYLSDKKRKDYGGKRVQAREQWEEIFPPRAKTRMGLKRPVLTEIERELNSVWDS